MARQASAASALFFDWSNGPSDPPFAFTNFFRRALKSPGQCRYTDSTPFVRFWVAYELDMSPSRYRGGHKTDELSRSYISHVCHLLSVS